MLVLYLVLSYVVLTNVPATSLESHTETAVAQAAYPVLGVWGFMAVSVAALIATASAINATMFSMLDISRALAHNGQLGAIFKQPFWGSGTEGFFYLLLGILVMTNAFNLVAIANLAGACFLISYLAVFVAHWRLRKETQGNVLLIILGFLLMLFILGAFFYQMFFMPALSDSADPPVCGRLFHSGIFHSQKAGEGGFQGFLGCGGLGKKRFPSRCTFNAGRK